MAPALCDICGRRPAQYTVRVRQNGEERTINVCAEDYAQLMRNQNRSPLESLFGRGGGGSLFDDFFGRDSESFGGDDMGSPMRRGRDREGVDINRMLSEQTKELLQSASRIAQEWGRHEIDTEHLLYALTENDVATAVLKQFKVDAADLQRQIETEAEKGELDEDQTEMGVSPRVKSVIERALMISRDLGHTYIGPEHLMIGLSEEEGLAGELLRRYGLTPEALRQKTVKVVGKGAEEGRVG
jgi:ATP-dependent Clp protease ATP-binding subunit ClpC